jgi:hypothetical protein
MEWKDHHVNALFTAVEVNGQNAYPTNNTRWLVTALRMNRSEVLEHTAIVSEKAATSLIITSKHKSRRNVEMTPVMQQ